MPNEKYLWCPECKEYPDVIQEDYEWYREVREWDEEDYYIIGNPESGESQLTCKKCGSTLEEK